MSSDGRYMYHHHSPGMNSSYEYASYPPSYENTQIPQPPLRPMRSTSQSHSPHSHPQSQFNPPPSQTAYQPPYSTPYGMPQQGPPPQWTGEGWTSYNQSFPPPSAPPPAPAPAPIQEVPFNSGPGRPDGVPNTSVEQRVYASSSSQSNPDPRRTDERQGAPPTTSGPPTLTASQAKRRRDKDSPTASGVPGTSLGLDFMKLIDSYRVIIDSSEAFSEGALSASSRLQLSETMDRMLQSATYGAQLLESASMQLTMPPDVRPPVERDTEESREGVNGTAKRQKTEEAPVQEGQTCLGCNATSTPEWRRGPMGPRTLCNACGLVYAKLIKKRVREGGRAFGKTNGQAAAASQALGDDSGLASSGEGGSEDGDSYGSQDRRSEGGEGRD